MTRHPNLTAKLGFLAAALILAGCAGGASVSGRFDRTFDITGPARLELANASGDVEISGSTDDKVHVHGEVRASGLSFEDPQKRLNNLVSNPPIEQKGSTIRIGKDFSRLRNTSISYVIEVPHETEVTTSLASGSQTVRGVRGPVKAEAASGSIHIERIDRDAQLATASGSISASEIGDDVRASSASGSITISNAKGDVKAKALAGVIQVLLPGGRVDADTASGSIDVQGATRDVTARAVSGHVAIHGTPGANSYWELKTVSGAVELSVPPSANFRLNAEAVSGEIRTDIPVVIEEQGKHSLRARVGNGGSRVEVHTISGEIRVRGAS
jgi:DUF4097 and DUF4098 domain-containing protein YvlB